VILVGQNSNVISRRFEDGKITAPSQIVLHICFLFKNKLWRFLPCIKMNILILAISVAYIMKIYFMVVLVIHVDILIYMYREITFNDIFISFLIKMKIVRKNQKYII
jgi:hypothetical protein